MNKTAIKNFAVWARKKLITDITYQAGLLGVTESGAAKPLPQSTRDMQFFDIGTKDYAKVSGRAIDQRNKLVEAIWEREADGSFAAAFRAVVEEVAYTWFNRLIAIRFMEVNDYLPSRVRVLSSEKPAKAEPDFVTTPFEAELDLSPAEQEDVLRLKDENKLDELFRMLFIKQCNKLHEILPELFEETNNYTELLLSISFTDNDGIVYHLVHDIPEDDFNVEKEGQVEIIGWMYQYYNIEPKDETFALLKKNVKITKERIPAATQLFTPDWIVRYMVENSLGRLWVEGHPSDSLKGNWKYYLEEAEQEASVQAQLEQIRAEYRNLNPEDIKVIDPCMGSGHILVYCFDVLMQIYESQGYTQRDAAQSILENNLFGLDIDKRAAQLAYFAVMMKARQYDRRIFTREIKPHVYAIEESNSINRGQLKYFGADLSPIERNKAKLQISDLLDTMVDAKEYGSILNVENYDWALLQSFAESIDDAGQMTLDTIGIDQTQVQLLKLIEITHTMAQKYEVVVTNPPYMGASGMDATLSKFVKDSYPDTKSDLFSCFIEKGFNMASSHGFISMITMESWMFLTSFEKMRHKIVQNKRIINMVHMPYLGKGGTSLGINFGTAAVVFNNLRIKRYEAQYDYIRYYETNENGVPFAFPTINERYKTATTDNFAKIPGSPIAYWVSNEILHIYDVAKTMDQVATPKQGFATTDNDTFLRFWHEVSRSKFSTELCDSDEIVTGIKWVPYNKGGAYRKWYGNYDYVCEWENAGHKLKTHPKAVLRNLDYQFKKSITWSLTNSSYFGARCRMAGSLFDTNGMSLFANERIYNYLLAFLCSKPASAFMRISNPTLASQVGDIARLPIIIDDSKIADIDTMVQENIATEKEDWDSVETSWDFKIHPLLEMRHNLVEDAFADWMEKCQKRCDCLLENEKKLNEIFIQLYNLEKELTPEMTSEDMTITTADLGKDIRSLLSYAVGCMFGRYSLDEAGLAYAGGEWDSRKYSTFIPDKDNCIPITDEAYFEDDIVGQFVGWMKKAFGEENLETNLDFIAKALGNKGATSREVIRNYFLSDFMKDHIKMYQKRPIYWLFDSGKQDGFKALVYMHRWNADTVGNLRVEYLHKMQHTYESEIVRMQETIDNSRDSREVSKATKRKDKLQKQLKETKDYDAQIAHIALSRIDIDLDDGVKVNYEKVQTTPDGKRVQILAKM